MARRLLKQIIYILTMFWKTRKTSFFDFDPKFFEVIFTRIKKIFNDILCRFTRSKLENILVDIADIIRQPKDDVFIVFFLFSFIFYLSYY